MEEIKEFFNELLNLNNPENKVFEVEYLLKLKLIDMFLYKTKVVEVSQQEKNNFYAIIGFTENEALNYFSKSLQERKHNKKHPIKRVLLFILFRKDGRLHLQDREEYSRFRSSICQLWKHKC